MEWRSILCVWWKVLAIFSLPLLIIIIILITNASDKTTETAAIQDFEITHESNLWPSGIVPYNFEPYMADAKLLIKNALKVFQNKTCLKFKEKETSDVNWLTFFRNDDICADSQVGKDVREKGQQKLSLGLDCLTIPILQRMVGRAVGLDFEEIRPDRNKFISIDPGCEDGSDFNGTSRISSRHNPAALQIFFDYGSHMFSDSSCVKAKSGSIPIGSHNDKIEGTFSVLDIEKLNAIYNCPGCNSYRFLPINKLSDSVEVFQSFKPVEAGYDVDGLPLYICRVYHLGSIIIGKLKTSLAEDLCWIADNEKEYRRSKTFEVLTNPTNANFSWIPQIGSGIPVNAVPGGRTADRKTLFIGRCSVKSDGNTSLMPSSIYPGSEIVFKVPFGHKAVTCTKYEILVCND